MTQQRGIVKKKARRDHPLLVAFFVVPAFLATGLFIAYPAIMSAYYSFYQWSGLSSARTFVGWENWQRLFSDPIIVKCLVHNLELAAVAVFVEVPLAFAIALILARGRILGRHLYRTAYFFPVIVSVTVVGVLWCWVYNPQYGLLNEGLRTIGLGRWTQSWLGDSKLAMPAVLLVSAWRFTGFYVVVFMAALESVPQDIYDVATLDGANGWQLGVRVLVPMLRQVIVAAIAIAIAASVQRFDLVYVMTMGGPAHATEVLATYMYKEAFLAYEMGYASSIAFFLFLLTLSLVAAQIQSTQSKEVVEF
jgi:raffinose/stachyose/melibiose transport system permease protein